MFFLSTPTKKKSNNKQNPQKAKIHQAITKEITKMKSILYWTTIPEHEACPGVWLVYPVSLHWRKLISPSLGTYLLQIVSQLGVGLCAHFLLSGKQLESFRLEFIFFKKVLSNDHFLWIRQSFLEFNCLGKVTAVAQRQRTRGLRANISPQSLFFKKNYEVYSFNFMFKCFLAHTYVHHGGHDIGSPAIGIAYKWLGSTMWVLRNKPWPLKG